ncbi:DUF1338 domain-containing protein [Chitinibacter tainanensis]|uniref:DUF1338 domain-containing protein n=1 Tax=Chitinibacter tainanensis TaxID=230667 RepID=UPI002352C9DF|nr:DUF1338 domain-containing protein [Chitinibacter tainanensis]
MDYPTFFARLWDDYTQLNPQAAIIRARFGGAQVPNDHVAFRTFATPELGIAVLEPWLLELGYRREQRYVFPDKHLQAWGYVHLEPTAPLVFLSELQISALPDPAQGILARLLGQLTQPPDLGYTLFWAGRLWPAPTYAEFQALAAVSEYAAWLAVHGLHANHFTIAVHLLGVSLQEVVDTLLADGYPMNTAGGLIKGQPEDLLIQAATLASPVEVALADGRYTVPGCYYEFAQRFRQPDGQWYSGFVAANANQIFTSTNRATNRAMNQPAAGAARGQ